MKGGLTHQQGISRIRNNVNAVNNALFFIVNVPLTMMVYFDLIMSASFKVIGEKP